MQDLKVIYEDNHIIVVEKIPNVPSQSDKTVRKRKSDKSAASEKSRKENSDD